MLLGFLLLPPLFSLPNKINKCAKIKLINNFKKNNNKWGKPVIFSFVGNKTVLLVTMTKIDESKIITELKKKIDEY